MRLFRCLALSCLAAPILAAARPAPPASSGGFRLRQVMSAPFPIALTAARHADVAAWVMNLEGVRNVWVAAGPGFHARQLTHYDRDNGVDINALHLTADGRTVVYALGNDHNLQGQISDPDSSVIPPTQAVWAVDIAGGAPRRLGEMNCGGEGCEDIRISPDGRNAVWPARGQIWIAPLSGARPARRLCYVRGDNLSPRWSPDSRRVAFVSLRGDHSLIAVYSFNRRHLVYMAPSVDHDWMPRWAPDGRLAFMRTAGSRLHQTLIPVHPQPFSIWVGNAQTGAARKIWQSGPRPQDSLPWQTEGEAFRFTGKRITFSSWQDGRLHLYSIPVAGGVAQRLTSGAFDVKDIRFSPDERTILYSSNEGDVDRRHCWRVSVAGGAPRPLTSGHGIEWTPVETGGGHILYLGAGARRPGLPYLWSPSGARPLTPRLVPADFPLRQMVIPRQVLFHSPDGLLIHAQLFMPHGRLHPGPALIYVHGGSMRQMVLGWNPMRYYYYAYAENQYLANRGFIVLSVNYRSGTMYGYAFRHPAHYGWRGASEYQDVIAGARYLRKLPQVNPRAIGIWGGSYGGYLTAMALARNSDIFAAGVDMHGVHDWWADRLVMYPGRRGVRYSDYAAAEKLAWQSSPDAYIAGWRSPVLLIQGDDDRNVIFSQTVDLAQRLHAHHVPFQTLIFPDEVHSFLRWRTWMRAYAATARFFEQTLVRRQLPPVQP